MPDTYIDSLYVEINRNKYENYGVIEPVDSVFEGKELFELMIEGEETKRKTFCKTVEGGFDIISPVLLNTLLICIGGKTGKVAGYFINHRDGYNFVRTTLRKVAKSTGVSLPTVNLSLQKLKSVDLIRKSHGGEYMISPYLIHRGKISRVPYLSRLYDRINSKESDELDIK